MKDMSCVCKGVYEVPELFLEEGLIDHFPVGDFFAEDEWQYIIF